MKLFNNLFHLLIFQRWSVTPERKKSKMVDKNWARSVDLICILYFKTHLRIHFFVNGVLIFVL